MDVNIKNSTNGLIAGVTKEHQLRTFAENIPQQHFISKEFGQTFQAFGSTGTLSSGTLTSLHLKNDDPTRLLVVTYIRLQLVGASGGSFASLDNYSDIGFGRTVSSGGAPMEPTNMNKSSGVVPLVTATETAPTMTGTFVSNGDKWWPSANGTEETYNKAGSLILGLNDTLEIRYVGTHTAGELYSRVTFMMVNK